MKANYQIPDTMLENEDRFSHPFFTRFPQREHKLDLGNSLVRPYRFPTFYEDVSCAMAVFLCDYRKTRELIGEKLSAHIKPVRMTHRHSAIAFSCYAYRTVQGIPAYNEIAVAIPVMVASPRVPILPLAMPTRFSSFGLYIAAMPVTSHENTLRGNKIWGLPKTTRDIEMKTDTHWCTTEVREESGESSFKLRVPVQGGKPKHFDTALNLYSRLDGQILKSTTHYQGTFNLTLFPRQDDEPFLELFNTPSAFPMGDLDIGRPIQVRWCEHMRSCYDLPVPFNGSHQSQLNRRFQRVNCS